MTTGIDTHSTTWAAVKVWAEAYRIALRTKIDSPATPHDATQVLRGQLIAITDLLALTEERPPLAVHQETYGL